MVYRLIVVLFFGGMVGVCVQAAVPVPLPKKHEKESEDQLFAAIKDGDLNALEKLYAAGIDLNKPHEKTGHTPLMLAVAADYPLVVNMLLANKKINIDEQHKATGNTALMIAILECQNRTFAEQLINAKADPNVRNKNKETALLYAVRKGRRRIVIEMLIEARATVDAASSVCLTSSGRYKCGGETALTCAIKDGKLDVVKLLLHHGADLNKPDRSGFTPLTAAMSLENVELKDIAIVKELLDAGADPNQHNKHGKTAFDYAKENGFDLEGLLLRRAGNSKPRAGFLVQNDSESKEIAVGIEQRQLVQAIAAVPADLVAVAVKVDWEPLSAVGPEQTSVQRRSVPELSLVNSNTPSISSLIAYGRPNDFDVKLDVGQEGDTELIVAIKTGKAIEEVKRLCSQNTINASGKRGYSPLVLAIGKNRSDYVSLLLENGATFTDVDRNGWTVLMCAAKKGNVEIVEALIDAGADLNAWNHNDQTALMVAAKYGKDQVRQLLLSKQALGDAINTKKKINKYGLTKYLMMAAGAEGDDVRTVETLLAEIKAQRVNRDHRQADLCFEGDPLETSFDDTALGGAIVAGNVNIAKILLSDADVKATINGRYKLGNTPLMNAVCYDNNEFVDLLLKAGAKVDAQCDLGNTALMEAVQIGNHGAARLLIEAGANVRVRNGFEKTAFDYVLEKDVEMTALLAAAAEVRPPLAISDPLPLNPSSSFWFLPSSGVAVSLGLATLLAAAALYVWRHKYSQG